jgi:hypothetical protein
MNSHERCTGVRYIVPVTAKRRCHCQHARVESRLGKDGAHCGQEVVVPPLALKLPKRDIRNAFLLYLSCASLMKGGEEGGRGEVEKKNNRKRIIEKCT